VGVRWCTGVIEIGCYLRTACASACFLIIWCLCCAFGVSAVPLGKICCRCCGLTCASLLYNLPLINSHCCCTTCLSPPPPRLVAGHSIQRDRLGCARAAAAVCFCAGLPGAAAAAQPCAAAECSRGAGARMAGCGGCSKRHATQGMDGARGCSWYTHACIGQACRWCVCCGQMHAMCCEVCFG
jgi:hypothetical protein